MKIRGTAAQIAEKYTALARDAMSAGDIIGAESYLQHAEHYNRIIMAAQSQMPANGQYPGDGYNGAPMSERQPDEFNGGYRERPAPYADEPRPPAQPQPSPAPRQHISPHAAPDSPQPTIPAAGGRESNEGGRRRRRRHQPNGAEHALAEAGEGGGRTNGSTRGGGMSSSDESVAS